MPSKEKKIVILTNVELKKTISRLTFEIIEKLTSIDDLLLLGIPTRGVYLAKVFENEIFSRTGIKVSKGIIDPTFYRDDQQRVETRLLKATEIPIPIENKEIVLIDDVIFTGRTVRAAIEALLSWGRPKKIMLLAIIDRGHRELPIQPDFCGRKVPTSKKETINLCLKQVDGEEGIFLDS